MFKKTIKALAVVAVAMSFTACSITLPVTATSNKIGSKVGTSKATVIIGLYFNEDASIQSAAQDGGISKISTVDIKYGSILGLVQTYETIVTGE